MVSPVVYISFYISTGELYDIVMRYQMYETVGSFKVIGVSIKPLTYLLACVECGETERVTPKQAYKRINRKRPGCSKCQVLGGTHLGGGRPLEENSTTRIVRVMYSQYRTNARVRSLPFELLLEEFAEIVIQPCHYCNREGLLRWDATRQASRRLCGVDRKNPAEGYTVKNCVPACTTCNRAKRDMTYDEFMDWVQDLMDNQREMW